MFVPFIPGKSVDGVRQKKKALDKQIANWNEEQILYRYGTDNTFRALFNQVATQGDKRAQELLTRRYGVKFLTPAEIRQYELERKK